MSIDLSTDAKNMIDSDLDSETVRYCPYKGIPRSVVVLIDREIPEFSLTLDGGTFKSVRRVTLVNSETTGVKFPKVGQDTIELKDQLHDSSVSVFRVYSVVSQDPGVIVLDVVR